MASLHQFLVNIWETAESILPMEGPLAGPFRFLIGAAAGGLIIFAWRPQVAFTENGSRRPWIMMPDLFVGYGEPTPFPWFFGPLLGGFILSTFI